jgi:hypothetical protein
VNICRKARSGNFYFYGGTKVNIFMGGPEVNISMGGAKERFSVGPTANISMEGQKGIYVMEGGRNEYISLGEPQWNGCQKKAQRRIFAERPSGVGGRKQKISGRCQRLGN